MKLINNFINISRLKATPLPRLYETTGPKLLQKSEIVVRGRRANTDDDSELALLPSIDLFEWNF